MLRGNGRYVVPKLYANIQFVRINKCIRYFARDCVNITDIRLDDNFQSFLWLIDGNKLLWVQMLSDLCDAVVIPWDWPI